MKRLLPAIIIIYIFIVSSTALANPNDTDLEKAFSDKLSKEWILIEFEVDVSENYGTKVEPLWKYRFSGEVELNVATYTRDRQQHGVLFLKQTGQTGEKENLFGIATAKMYQGKWKISFKLDENPLDKYGYPRESYKSRTIIAGSSEGLNFISEIRRKEEQKKIALAEKRKKEQIASKKRKQELALEREKTKRGQKLISGINKTVDMGKIRELLQQGVELELTDYNSRTPLMLAARYGHIDLVKLLLSSGANINHKNLMHMTALDWTNKGHTSNKINAPIIAKYLKSVGGKYGKEIP